MNPIHDPLDRRLFVRHCAKLAFGLSVFPLHPVAAAPRGPGFGKAKSIIMIFLDGGLSHIDSFDPKSGPGKGPGDPVSTKGGFQITSFFPETAKVADKLTVIRSMSAKVGVHDAARYLMRTGYEKRGTIVHPNLGAWARHYLGADGKTLPSSVTINHGSEHGNGFFPATYSPLPIFDPETGLANIRGLVDSSQEQKRLELLRRLNTGYLARMQDENVRAYTDFYDSTLRLMQSSDLKAFDLGQEPEEIRARYGRQRFGQGCLLARRLVEHGVRFVEIHSGGWDMHKELEDGMEEKGGELDRGFAALVADLEARGLLESTLVAVTTEFGRKPALDGNGRGHHPIAFSCVLAGGGVRRGYVHGATDDRGQAPRGGAVSPGDLHATLGWAAGLPLEEEFTTPSGRPMSVGNKGKPVTALFA